jgi:hypothetical protein
LFAIHANAPGGWQVEQFQRGGVDVDQPPLCVKNEDGIGQIRIDGLMRNRRIFEHAHPEHAKGVNQPAQRHCIGQHIQPTRCDAEDI